MFAAGICVRLAADIAGSVPVKFAAGTFVKFAADIAGNAPLNFDAVRVDILASATVPDAMLLPFKAVRFAPLIAGSVPVIFAAGTFVKFAALIAGRVPVRLAAADWLNLHHYHYELQQKLLQCICQ